MDRIIDAKTNEQGENCHIQCGELQSDHDHGPQRPDDGKDQGQEGKEDIAQLPEGEVQDHGDEDDDPCGKVHEGLVRYLVHLIGHEIRSGLFGLNVLEWHVLDRLPDLVRKDLSILGGQ